jgi:hypothetical protein
LLELLCALGREGAVGGLPKLPFEEIGGLAPATGGFPKVAEECPRERGVLAALVAIAAAGIVAARGGHPAADAPGQGLEGLPAGSTALVELGRRR